MYHVSEDTSHGVVEICAVVYTAKDIDCPVKFPFSVTLRTSGENEGVYYVCILFTISLVVRFVLFVLFDFIFNCWSICAHFFTFSLSFIHTSLPSSSQSQQL